MFKLVFEWCRIHIKIFRNPHKIAGNHQFPGRTWVETVGDGPGGAARVSSGKWLEGGPLF